MRNNLQSAICLHLDLMPMPMMVIIMYSIILLLTANSFCLFVISLLLELISNGMRLMVLVLLCCALSYVSIDYAPLCFSLNSI